MSEIIITKGKLLKGDKVEIEYQQKHSSTAKPANCSYEQDETPRIELKKAFSNLAIHAALLGEFIPLKSIKKIDAPDPELVKDFNASGFTISASKKGDEGLILTAQKTLSSGRTLGFNTPVIRLDDESENAYPFSKELSAAVDVCKDELTQYLNGVRGEDPQGKLQL